MDYQELLNRIKAKADLLLQQDHLLSRREAFREAFVDIIMVDAESNAADPFERVVLEAIERAQVKNKGLPVLRSEIVRELELMGHTSVGEWTVWHTISSLETRDLVYRPGGSRSRKWAIA